MQPGQGTLDHPPGSPQAAAVRRPALGELGSNPSPPELVAVGLRIVSAVALDQLRLPRGSAGAPAQRRHRIDEREQLGDVVPIRGCQCRDERNPVRVGENMMFRPGFAAIGRWAEIAAPVRPAPVPAAERRSSVAPRLRRDSARCRRARANGAMKRPLDAAGAVDAQTAPTAPWKTHSPGFPQRPQAVLPVSSCGTQNERGHSYFALTPVTVES